MGIPKKGGDREAVLLFTSGSSGEPKGVALTHRFGTVALGDGLERVLHGPFERLFQLMEDQSREERYLALVQRLAEVSEEAVILHTHEHDLYLNGLGYLFSQPEFSDRENILGLSRELDRLDEVMDALTMGDDASVSVVIGGNNPFGDEFSLVLGRLRTDPPSLVGLLGPMRMPYGRTISTVRFMASLMSEMLATFYDEGNERESRQGEA